MKKKKCLLGLGLVAIAASVVALTGCERVSAADDGVIFTYTDASGARTTYTASQLFKSYQTAGSSLSSEFDKIYEVLIRHYYECYEDTHSNDNGEKMKALQATATTDVTTQKNNAKSNANNNGTTYETEWESILDAQDVDNVDELYQKFLYEAEKEDFEAEFTDNLNTGSTEVSGLEAMRDGQYTLNGETVTTFPESDAWGKGSEGWLKEQMPYHVSSILVKLASGGDKEYTQDKVTEPSTNEKGEASKLSEILFSLAGIDSIASDGSIVTASGDSREQFGIIAKRTDDDSASSVYGELSQIVTKDPVSDLVPEFKLGIYAYESLYNQREGSTEDAYRLMPGLTEDASSASDVDANQVLTDGTSVYDYFSNLGIGEIPYGAVLAMADTAKTTKDDNGDPVNKDNAEIFYPRNVIFNKYFNKHNVCVITPNVIPTNAAKDRDGNYRYSWMNKVSSETQAAAEKSLTDLYNCYDRSTGTVTGENDLSVGEYAPDFGALPGFSVDTTNILPQFANNVLTDDQGRVILAVRDGSGSSYQGVHFIVVDRGALDAYGHHYDSDANQNVLYTESEVKNNGEYVVNSPSLSDYWTIYNPATDSKYPTYKNGETTSNLNTYVNFNTNETKTYTERVKTVTSSITTLYSDLNTYEFQMLVENNQIEFTDESMKEAVQNYSITKRQSSIDETFDEWKDAWKEYAESLQAQEEKRDYGAGTLKGTLITELDAVYYGVANENAALNPVSALYSVGGACYYAN